MKKILVYTILLISCQSKQELIEKKQKAKNLQVEKIERHHNEYRYQMAPPSPQPPPTYPWDT